MVKCERAVKTCLNGVVLVSLFMRHFLILEIMDKGYLLYLHYKVFLSIFQVQFFTN